MDKGHLADVTTDDSSSFKHKSSFFKPLSAADNKVFKDVKIAVPLNYLSNFWRSLEMLLINCKIHLELNWSIDCVMSSIAGNTTSKITNLKLHVPIVTLSRTDNVKLVKLLGKEFNRPVKYSTKQKKKQKIETTTILHNFLLMLLFKELKDCFFLLLTILIMLLKRLTETVTQNIFFQE